MKCDLSSLIDSTASAGIGLEELVSFIGHLMNRKAAMRCFKATNLQTFFRQVIYQYSHRKFYRMWGYPLIRAIYANFVESGLIDNYGREAGIANDLLAASRDIIADSLNC